MIQVFSKEWFSKHQRALLWFVNTKLGKWFFRILEHKSKRIITIAPNYLVWQNEQGQYVAEFRTHNRFARRLYHGLKPLWHILHLWDLTVANRVAPSLNVGFDTFYPDEDPETTTVDGTTRYTQSNPGQDYTVLRANAGSSFSSTTATSYAAYLLGGDTTDKFRNIYRAFFLFDTSALADGATIASASLDLYGVASSVFNLGTVSLHAVSSNPASNTDLVAADHTTLGSTSFGSVISSSWVEGNYNSITLDANGIANINTTGISKFGTRDSWDLNNSFTGTWAFDESYFFIAFAESIGTSTDPKLVVTLLGSDGSNGNLILLGIG